MLEGQAEPPRSRTSRCDHRALRRRCARGPPDRAACRRPGGADDRRTRAPASCSGSWSSTSRRSRPCGRVCEQVERGRRSTPRRKFYRRTSARSTAFLAGPTYRVVILPAVRSGDRERRRLDRPTNRAVAALLRLARRSWSPRHEHSAGEHVLPVDCRPRCIHRSHRSRHGPRRFLPLIEWIAAAGLSGRRERELLQGFCERALALGLPLSRAVIGVDTLHPMLEGRRVRMAARPRGRDPVRVRPPRPREQRRQMAAEPVPPALRKRCDDASASASATSRWTSRCSASCGSAA